MRGDSQRAATSGVNNESVSLLPHDPASAPPSGTPDVIKRSLLSTLIGFLMMVGACVGLRVFLNSSYLTDAGPYPYNAWLGYTVGQFWALCAFMVLATLSWTLTYVGISAGVRHTGNALWVGLHGAFAVITLIIGCGGMVWGWEIMKCGAIGCVGTKKYTEVQYARPEAGIGFTVAVGLEAFFSLVPVGILLLYRTVQLLRSRSGIASGAIAQTGGGQAMHGDNCGALSAPFYRNPFLWGAITVVFGFFLMCATFYIPNSWEYFVAARIAQNANKQVTTLWEKCNVEWHVYMCTEMAWAWFRTKNWKLGEEFYLKLYPGNLIFYIYLFIMVLASLFLFNVSHSVNKAWSKVVINFQGTFRGRKRWWLSTRWTIAEIVGTLFTIVMIVLFLIYWAQSHNYNGYQTSPYSTGVTHAERWARTWGQMAVLFLSLLLFPASRNSIMHHILGTSWEAFLWAHRVLGYGMLATTFLHMVFWWRVYAENNIFPKAIFSIPIRLPASIDNFTVCLSNVAVFYMYLAMGVFAFEPIRRRCFELFYYSHLLGAYLVIPATLWHAAAGWEYMLPGLTVWFLDRVVRMARSSSGVRVLSAVAHEGKVTEIRFVQPSMTLAPGQYVFINIPQLSIYEWHPFTISSGTECDYFSLHIRSMGDGTWTDRLHKWVASSPDINRTFSLSVDGPYGQRTNYAEYDRVLFFAGGIGITPCSSIFNSHKEATSLRLVWSVRECSMVPPILPMLGVNSRESNSIAHIHTTRASSLACPLPERGVQFQEGRPNVDEIIWEEWQEAQQQGGKKLLVFCCGPEEMVSAVLSMCDRHGVPVHRETFLL